MFDTDLTSKYYLSEFLRQILKTELTIRNWDTNEFVSPGLIDLIRLPSELSTCQHPTKQNSRFHYVF